MMCCMAVWMRISFTAGWEMIRWREAPAAICCQAAVSYTHLDVYKRQAEYPRRALLSALVFLFLSLGWSIIALIYYSVRDLSLIHI